MLAFADLAFFARHRRRRSSGESGERCFTSAFSCATGRLFYGCN